jgi:hypothetical protein
MKRISDDEVEYESTDEESAAELFDSLLTHGLNIPRAVEVIRSCPPFTNLGDEFFDWLGQ